MLEILIIICLAGALFLALKNFAKTGKERFSVENISVRDEPKKKWWSFWHEKPKNNYEDIMQEIEKNQAGIVAPSEINQVKEQYKEENPEVAKFLYEADLALMRNDLREAENLAVEAISKEKKCAQAYVIIGKVAKERGAFAEARESYKAALKCDREAAEAYFGLGQVDLREENISSAIENLQKSVAIERGHADWYAELGKAYSEVRQFAKAAKYFKKAVSLDLENKEYKKLSNEAEEKKRAHSTVYRSR